MEKTLKSLNLEDDFLFAKVMTDRNICRRVLERILGIVIDRIEIPNVQSTIDILLGSKGIRLDVYVRDGKGTVFNCEMQRGKKKELPKRSRYYQGNLDLDLIAKGKKYTELTPSYVIFICTFDPFGKKRSCYTFKETCVEDNTLLLGDETVKIFLSTKGGSDSIDPELKEFLGYVENSTDEYAEEAKSDLVKSLHKRVTEVKDSKEMEVEFMTLMQRDMEMREEGWEEGREKTINIIKRFQKGFSAAEIAKELEIDIKVVEKCILDFKS